MLKKRFKDHQKGSLTVEAALALPMFMAFMLLIASISRVYYTHELVQYALNDAANEVASTCYLFKVTGVLSTYDEVYSTFDDRAQLARADFERLTELMNLGDQLKSEIQEVDVGSTGDSISKGKQLTGELSQSIDIASEDPVGYLKSIVSNGVTYGMSKGKNAAMSTLVKAFMKKHIDTNEKSADERLLGFHVQNGFEGLSFEGSEYFVDDEILNIKVSYTLDKVDPFGLVKNIPLTNQVVVRAWISGNDSGENYPAMESEIPSDDNATIEKQVTEENASTEKERESQEEQGEQEYKASMYIYGDTKSKEIFHTDINCRDRKDYTPPQLYEGTYIKNDNGEDLFVYEGKTYRLCQNCASGQIGGGK